MYIVKTDDLLYSQKQKQLEKLFMLSCHSHGIVDLDSTASDMYMMLRDFIIVPYIVNK